MSNKPQPVLSSLFCYPLKSAAAIAIGNSIVDKTGIRYDRQWAIFDDNNCVITAREMPEILGITINTIGDDLNDSITTPDFGPFQLHFEGEKSPEFSATMCSDVEESVTLFKETVSVREVDQSISTWLSKRLARPCRLMRTSNSSDRAVLERRGGIDGDIMNLADECPILLISTASVDDLNSRLGLDIPITQVRANLVVSGVAPYQEDSWKTVKIGDVFFDVTQPCKRCSFLTIDPQTHQPNKDQQPLRTLATYRRLPTGGASLGMHLIPRSTGELSIGDKITVIK